MFAAYYFQSRIFTGQMLYKALKANGMPSNRFYLRLNELKRTGYITRISRQWNKLSKKAATFINSYLNEIG